MEQKLSSGGSVLYCSPAVTEASVTQSNKPASPPTFIFVHNMWSSHKVFHRHVKLVNRLGYPTVTFDLYKSQSTNQVLSYLLENPLTPIYKTHLHQINDVLESVKGPKIVFCFSGPSLAGLIAASSRNDVLAYICDGGPFREIWACTLRMFEQQKLVPTKLLQALATTLSFLVWGLNSFKEFHRALDTWPQKIPILSLRGQQDSIVHLENIENAFKDHPNLPLTAIEFPEVHHLNGLKKFPQEYEAVVVDFLKNI